MVRERLGGLEYYLAKGSQRGSEDKAIVLGTDIFGLGLPNPKIMADLFAERTRPDVYVPDYFQGEYMDQKELKPPGGGGPTPLGQEWRKKYSIDLVRPGVEAVSPYFAFFIEPCLFGLGRVSGSAMSFRASRRDRKSVV